MESFSIYFSLGFLENHIYGNMSSEKFKSEKNFIHYQFLYEFWKNIDGEEENKIWFVIDNASINKAAYVRHTANKRQLRLLTIPSNSSFLNGTETIIQAIKSKVKQKL